MKVFFIFTNFVLLPIMHQILSRLTAISPDNETLKSLIQRPLDIIFFGLITKRRKFLLEEKEKYQSSHPNSKILISKTRPKDLSYKASAYRNAKVCIIAHSFWNISGGEYHRLTEFGQYGCIPVMEEFADKIGMNQYRHNVLMCSLLRKVFAKKMSSH